MQQASALSKRCVAMANDDAVGDPCVQVSLAAAHSELESHIEAELLLQEGAACIAGGRLALAAKRDKARAKAAAKKRQAADEARRVLAQLRKHKACERAAKSRRLKADRLATDLGKTPLEVKAFLAHERWLQRESKKQKGKGKGKGKGEGEAEG
jgi:hypothetical protein